MPLPRPRFAAGSRSSPRASLAHSQLARVLWFGRADIAGAIAHFQQAAVLAPEAGYTHLQLALLQALSGDLDGAEQSARTAVDLQQKAMSGSQGLIVVGAHTRLGYVHYLRGHYEEAIREYRRELTFLTHSDHALRDRSIIEVNQKLAAAYARQGADFESREFADLAIEAFNRRLATGADDPHTRYYVAALYALRDDVEPVLRHLGAGAGGVGPVHPLAAAARSGLRRRAGASRRWPRACGRRARRRGHGVPEARHRSRIAGGSSPLAGSPWR